MSSTLDREHSTDESLFGSSPSPSPPSREPSTDESLFGSPPSSPSLPVEPSIVESAASGSPEPQSPILSDGTPDEMLESFCSVEESVVWDLANDKSHEMDFGVENWAPNQEAQDTFKQQAEIVNAVYARIPKPEKGRDLKKLTDDILLEAYETVNGLRIRKRKPKTFGQLSGDHQNGARVQGQQFIMEKQARRDKRKREEVERLEAMDTSNRVRTWQNGFLPNIQPQSQPMSFQQSQPMFFQQSRPMYYQQSQHTSFQQSQPMYHHQSQPMHFQHSQPTHVHQSRPMHLQQSQPRPIQQSQPMHLQQSQLMHFQQSQPMPFQQGQPMPVPSFGVGNAQNIPDGVFDNGVFDNGVFNGGSFDDTIFDGINGLNWWFLQ
ncbi:hypothetical protein FSHL1_002463 [Fusarium sambucinum]